MASDWPATVPSIQLTSRARTASMHCPKVSPRTATPVGTSATSVMPGIAATAAWLRIAFGLPFSVGARQIIVGLASGTSRSRVYCFVPVTAARASSRFCGVPMTV